MDALIGTTYSADLLKYFALCISTNKSTLDYRILSTVQGHGEKNHTVKILFD
jgi:hypothetical protein